MKDIQLYQQILGLVEPWRVESVTLRTQQRAIEVRVGFAETVWGCPECQQRMQIHDYEERRWRHLDSCQFKTIIVARVPVVRCPTHGSQTVAVPWAEKYSRFSRLFERLAIDVMLECSISGACEILGISWDEADGVKQRAVKRGLARKQPAVMPRLCVDEKGIGNGQNYMTIVAQVEPDRTTVQYVGEGREQESLDAFWRSLTPTQLAGVEAVGMDMCEAYVQSTLAHVPGAATKIVHDPFHLVKGMNQAVNEVRKSEHRRLQAEGDDTLKNTRQLWLYGLENVPAKHAQRFKDVWTINLQTSRAWMLKEVFRSFWLCETVNKAADYFDRWYSQAIRSRLDPVKKGFSRDLPAVFYWLKRHIARSRSPATPLPKVHRRPWTRLFAGAGRVRYAWRPAGTRTGVRESVPAARPPLRIDGAILPIPSGKCEIHDQDG